MSRLILLVLAAVSLSSGAPGILNTASKFLTSVVGAGGADLPGEVEDYENSPYTLAQAYDVSKNILSLIVKNFINIL